MASVPDQRALPLLLEEYFDAEDGRYTIALRRVVYVKRFARDTHVGFGAVGS